MSGGGRGKIGNVRAVKIGNVRAIKIGRWAGKKWRKNGIGGRDGEAEPFPKRQFFEEGWGKNTFVFLWPFLRPRKISSFAQTTTTTTKKRLLFASPI